MTLVAPFRSPPRPPRPRRVRLLTLTLTPLLLFLLSACGCGPSKQQLMAQAAVSDYFIGDFESAAERLRPLADTTDENFVLNNVRLGSSALVAYDLDEAERAFLRAYEVMNSVGVNDGGRSIGAALVDEKIRIWKGEPFERAMANFYLGLVYSMRQDYGNARAAFQNALFKLRDYGEAEGGEARRAEATGSEANGGEATGDGDGDADAYRDAENNFALAYLMLGRTFQRLGRDDDARDAFARAVELRPYLEPLADFDRNARSNVLLVVDYGQGPRKGSRFDGSIVAFGPTPAEVGPVPPPRVIVDGLPLDLEGADRPLVDLLALAQDRRWQSIDTIRTFKSVVGTGLMAGGWYEGTRRDGNSAVALGLILGGLAAKATSQADTRQWEMLPRTVFLLPLELPPGPHDVLVEFPDVPGLRQEWHDLVAPDQGEATYYFHMQRYNPGPFAWPPPALAGVMGEPQPPRGNQP